jgi:hypothetical protein
MPVEFLSDAEAASYGRYAGLPSRAELERFFFLDDADRELIAKRRGEASRLGFVLQLTTARFVGRFLPDPLDVPVEVVDYLAAQLDVADPSVVKGYTERRQTAFDHLKRRDIYAEASARWRGGPVLAGIGARRRAAGVVHQDVEPAERLRRAGHSLAGRLGVHQVDRDVDQVRAGEGVEFGAALTGGGHDTGALREQCARHGRKAADP